MKKVFLLLPTFVLLTACGPSVEELEAMSQEQIDSLYPNSGYKSTKVVSSADSAANAALDFATKYAIDSSKPQAYYFAADFALIPGTVYKYTPSYDYLNDVWSGENGDAAIQAESIQIQIVREDGSIKVMPCSAETFKILKVGSVLK